TGVPGRALRLLPEASDPSFRADRTAFAHGCERDAVVVFAVQQFPGVAVVQRCMGTGGADGDPAILGPGDGRAIGEAVALEFPGLAAVGGNRRGRAGFVGVAIIAADDHSMLLGAEGP